MTDVHEVGGHKYDPLADQVAVPAMAPISHAVNPIRQFHAVQDDVLATAEAEFLERQILH